MYVCMYVCIHVHAVVASTVCIQKACDCNLPMPLPGAAPYMSDAANIAPPGAVRSGVLSATRQKPLLCKLICPVSQRSKMIKDQRFFDGKLSETY